MILFLFLSDIFIIFILNNEMRKQKRMKYNQPEETKGLKKYEERNDSKKQINHRKSFLETGLNKITRKKMKKKEDK